MLEPCTSGTIAKKVRTAAETVEAPEIRGYLSAVANALMKAAELRNDVLHARPAAHPQQDQRLNRAEVLERRTSGKRFWIDDAWFDVAVEALNAKLEQVYAVRPPIH